MSNRLKRNKSIIIRHSHFTDDAGLAKDFIKSKCLKTDSLQLGKLEFLQIFFQDWGCEEIVECSEVEFNKGQRWIDSINCTEFAYFWSQNSEGKFSTGLSGLAWRRITWNKHQLQVLKNVQEELKWAQGSEWIAKYFKFKIRFPGIAEDSDNHNKHCWWEVNDTIVTATVFRGTTTLYNQVILWPSLERWICITGSNSDMSTNCICLHKSQS